MTITNRSQCLLRLYCPLIVTKNDQTCLPLLVYAERGKFPVSFHKCTRVVIHKFCRKREKSGITVRDDHIPTQVDGQPDLA